ncbi:uncharacterized protein LOC143152898 [Ptiloglossa arizonensis]|uniref:uncharacterized protein LOC143152898 n=1 Tax=Ptiloglossa arizonensis TaxID=3350558 RepID=UPI003FA0535E
MNFYCYFHRPELCRSSHKCSWWNNYNETLLTCRTQGRLLRSIAKISFLYCKYTKRVCAHLPCASRSSKGPPFSRTCVIQENLTIFCRCINNYAKLYLKCETCRKCYGEEQDRN